MGDVQVWGVAALQGAAALAVGRILGVQVSFNFVQVSGNLAAASYWFAAKTRTGARLDGRACQGLLPGSLFGWCPDADLAACRRERSASRGAERAGWLSAGKV